MKSARSPRASTEATRQEVGAPPCERELLASAVAGRGCLGAGRWPRPSHCRVHAVARRTVPQDLPRSYSQHGETTCLSLSVARLEGLLGIMRGVTPRRRGVTALPTHPGIRARRLYEDQARSLWVVSGDCLSMLVLWACARGRGMRTPKRNQSDVEVVGPGAIEGGGLQCQCTLESDRCGRVHASAAV